MACFKLGPSLYRISSSWMVRRERAQANAKERGSIISSSESLPIIKMGGRTESEAKQKYLCGKIPWAITWWPEYPHMDGMT